MTGTCLKLSDTKVIRSGRTILDVDNLQISSGQFVSLIGTNGAGKTTLLKVFCGLIKLNSGTVKFDDIDLTSLGSWHKSNLRKRIGYIPQAMEYNAELPFTVREVVAMGRTSVKPLFSRLNCQDYEIVDYWIEKLGLSKQREQTFRSLSGGEQQKALIARAMTQQPAVLMLDEPSSNLDFNWKSQIANIVEQLHRQMKITILMVSHETNLLPLNVERTVLLHEGRIIADGSSEDVFQSGQFKEAYQCKIKILDIDGRKYAVTMKTN